MSRNKFYDEVLATFPSVKRVPLHGIDYFQGIDINPEADIPEGY
jgi:hypothetical protein